MGNVLSIYPSHYTNLLVFFYQLANVLQRLSEGEESHVEVGDEDRARHERDVCDDNGYVSLRSLPYE